MKGVLPWVVGALAYVGPPTWAYFAIERDAAEQMATRGMACGNPTLAIMMLACIVSGALSCVAAGWRGWAVGWWREASWGVLIFEVATLLGPLIGSAGLWASLTVS